MKLDHKNVSSLLPLGAQVKLFLRHILDVFCSKWPEFQSLSPELKGAATPLTAAQCRVLKSLLLQVAPWVLI